MKCPICQWEAKEENPRFCAGCGWEFKLFLSDVGEAEKAAYAERVAIARKNWAELQEFRAGKKAAPEPPKETGSAGSPSEAKVPELTRDPFETAAEFEKRINDTPAIPAGTGRLIREEYDIDSGRFPVKVEWWDWAKALPGLPKDGDGLHVVAKRDLAKAIYESGPEHGISVKLKALDGKAAVESLVLLTDKGPIPVKSPSPGADKRISGPLPGMEFVWIPPGEFWMGSPEDEPGREDVESPRHRVRLTKGFHMQTTPVTQAQWEAVTGNNPSHFKNAGPNAPVEMVSWNDVQEFIRKLNQREGTGRFRLPTEAEWEYACRAGTETAFCNGPITDLTGPDPNLEKVGWFNKNSRGTTHPVAQKQPNSWGLHDMHGNVWEWCRDWFGEYPGGPVIDPTGPETVAARVLRGGGWYYDASYCRAASRVSYTPDNRNYTVGFRVVGRRAQY
jgi:formylglycine-generating enzyme required for sulfatase activity